jgi:hypothetical protein
MDSVQYISVMFYDKQSDQIGRNLANKATFYLTNFHLKQVVSTHGFK